ncbi:MAG: NAD-dependent epimerase [Pirellula sp.]|jgi:UDP-glucuronate 4-epimerase|nr:NAD-dependent epimerase [Pirellula sp.]
MAFHVLVTGAAGFIGYHTCQALLQRGDRVVGIDNLNDYYEVSLKQSRLSKLVSNEAFQFQKMDLADRDGVAKLFADNRFDRVIHLGAQAGVRYSLENPFAYIDSNITGTLTILEGCRHHRVPHLVYASSSSVYGNNIKLPFAESDSVDHPISLYAATKKSDELMAHTYSHLFGVPTTGLRFFTVYGPWGRPDMALFKFTKAILEGKPIDVYNHGNMKRDFTYVADIVNAVVAVSDSIPTANEHWNSEHPDPASSSAPYRVFNIGNHQSVDLLHFIAVLEKAIGKKAIINLMPMQAGDVPNTYADIQALHQAVGYVPTTSIEVGVPRFVEWYRDYYNITNS